MVDERDRSVAEVGERKPYTMPTLTEFGTIEDLTQGGGGTDFDPYGGESNYVGL